MAGGGRAYPGKPLEISASDWNAMLDLVAAAKKAGSATNLEGRDRAPLYALNNTEEDVELGQVLGIDAPLVLKSDSASQYLFSTGLSCTKPATASHIGKWCVALEPIAAGMLGRVTVSGLTVLQLTRGYADHPYVDIANSTWTAASNWYGAAELLHYEEVSGVGWGLVRLGNFEAPIYKAKTTEEIAVDSNGTCNIWYKGAVTSPASTVEVYLDWMDGGQAISTGKEIVTQFFRDQNKWIALGAEC